MIFVDTMGKLTFVEALKIGIASFCERYPALRPFHVKVSEELDRQLIHLCQFPFQTRIIRVSPVQSLPERCAPYYFARILATLFIDFSQTPQIDELLIVVDKEQSAC